MKVITTERIPIKMWLDELEEGAIGQAKNLANMPYAFSHIAIMPDSHKGFGMPIGAVLATKDVVVPNAVGVDINCGMVAVKTDLKAEHVKYDVVEDIMKRVERDIPVGFAQRHASMSVQTDDLLWSLRGELPEDGVVYKEYEKAGYQLGTLGGGNHFIEMDKGSDGYIWLMLHSGSRGIGNKVGTYYNKAAIKENEEHYVTDTVRADLAFLRADSQLGKDYLAEMKFCMEYANISRDIMMNTFISDLQEVITEAGVMDTIKIQHNFVDLEKHFGKNVWVHRKGAVPAYIGQRGIIAGSQGTASYIVAGKGNLQSFKTCSHGAGRRMSRTQAVKTLNLKEEQDRLVGIYNNMKTQKSLDEAPSSYKDIETVMNNQKDLVDVLVKLTPLGVVKG